MSALVSVCPSTTKVLLNCASAGSDEPDQRQRTVCNCRPAGQPPGSAGGAAQHGACPAATAASSGPARPQQLLDPGHRPGVRPAARCLVCGELPVLALPLPPHPSTAPFLCGDVSSCEGCLRGGFMLGHVRSAQHAAQRCIMHARCLQWGLRRATPAHACRQLPDSMDCRAASRIAQHLHPPVGDGVQRSQLHGTAQGVVESPSGPTGAPASWPTCCAKLQH